MLSLALKAAVAVAAIAASIVFLSNPPLVGSGKHATSFRFAETLTFERAGHVTKQSGVSEVTLAVGGALGYGMGVSVHYPSSQAIPIDIGGGDTLFALPTYPFDSNQRTLLLSAACGLPVTERTQDEKVLAQFIDAITSLREVCAVPVSSWPILVHFKDLADPYSIERVLPEELSTRFEGLRLQSVEVGLTQKEVTKGIENYLPWVLTGLPKGDLPIKTIEPHPRSRPIRLSTLDFWIKG